MGCADQYVGFPISASSYYTSGWNINPSPTATAPADFKWLSTDTVITYTNWYPGQPNRRHAGDICVVLIQGWGWKWDDGSCLVNKLAFACELY